MGYAGGSGSTVKDKLLGKMPSFAALKNQFGNNQARRIGYRDQLSQD
jgi:hypothetical protein